jgi:hypothetical protein
MANPSLVIGVGGSGQWAVAYLKKTLKDTYGNVPYEVVLQVFDTDARNPARVGGWGMADANTPPMDVVDVRDETKNIGINAKNNVKTWAKEQEARHQNPTAPLTNPCIAKWFDAIDYANDPQADGLCNLTQGAGQYRQLGRLTLFVNLQDATPLILTSLTTSLTLLNTEAIKAFNNNQAANAQNNNPAGANNAPSVDVYLVGSLAGGTGSSLFMDLAHLVKSIMKGVNREMGVRVFGYFVLPKGFGQLYNNMEDADKDAWQARSFAAMRENDRFSAGYDVNVPYPICYKLGGGAVLDGSVDGSLFEMIYYFDGQRANNSLANTRSEDGLCPMIAELIATGIDPVAGGWLGSHRVNVNAASTAVNFDIKDKVQIGSIGAYTWLLPMHTLVEEWSFKLAEEIMKEMLPGPVDATTNSNTDLEPEQGFGIENVNEWFKKETILFHGKWGYEDKTSPLTFEVLDRMEIQHWWDKIRHAPNLVENGTDWMARLNQAEMDIEAERIRLLSPYKKPINQIVGEVQPSTEIPNEKRHYGPNPEDGRNLAAERVRDEAEDKFKEITHKIGSALKVYADWQFEQFHAKLAAFCNDNMQNNASKSLGILFRYSENIQDRFKKRIKQIEKSIEDKKSQGNYNGWSQRQSSALQEMKNDIGKQKDYLDSSQHLLELEKFAAFQRANLDLLQREKSLIDRLLDDLGKWANALAKSSQSSFARIRNGINAQANAQAQYQNLSHVQNVIRDTAYEQKRYEFYKGINDQTIKSQWSWIFNKSELRIQGEHGMIVTPVISIISKIDNKDLSISDGSENQRILTERCKNVFEDAFGQESIADYLVNWYQKDPVTQQQPTLQNKGTAIAQDLWQMADPPLETNNPQTRRTYSKLQMKNANVNNLPNLKVAMEARFGTLAGAQLDKNKVPLRGTFQNLDAQDPFRMVYLHFDELLANQEAQSYIDGLAAYIAVPRRFRKRSQILPAEQHAFEYETRLGYPLHHRVVRLLEDLTRFNVIVEMLVYGSREKEQLLYKRMYTNVAQNFVTEWWLSLKPEPGTYSSSGGIAQKEHYIVAGDSESELVAFERMILEGKWIQYAEGDAVPDPMQPGWLKNVRKQGDPHDKELPFPVAHQDMTREIARVKLETYQEMLQQNAIDSAVASFATRLAALKGVMLETARKQVADFIVKQQKIREFTNKFNQMTSNQEKHFYDLLKTHLEFQTEKITRSIQDL